MKQIFTLILIALLSMVAGNMQAYDAKIDGIFYNFSGDEATVTKEKSPGTYTGNVVIPETVTYEGKTYKVTSIGESAFNACSNDFTSVVIPNSVTSIGNSAFYYCNGLTNISVPNSVKTIGQGAFMMCRNLTTVSMGNSIESVGQDCFAHCDNLTSINIPSSLTVIPNNFITGAIIKSIVIPEGVTTIGQTSFDCHLESITIPSTVTSIDKYAFGLGADINTPDTLKVYINNLEAWLKIPFAKEYEGHDRWNILHPFESRVSGGKSNVLYLNGEVLQDVVIPASMTTIPPYAFYGCHGIKTVTMHNAVTEIEAGAFSKCRNLESVVISNSVTKIGMNAFFQDTIQSLTIGTNVLEIGKEAFRYDYTSSFNSISHITVKKTIWLTNTPPKNYEQAAGRVNYVSNNLYNKFTITGQKTYVYPQLSSMFTRDGIKYVVVDIPSLTCDAIDCMYDKSAELTKLGTTVAYNANRTFKVLNVNPYTCCGNTFIKNVELTGLPFIEDHVFDGCTNLQSAKLPETVTYLGMSSFKKCSSLKDLIIPAATTEVKHNAFRGCTSLQNVTMNDGSKGLTLRYNVDEMDEINPTDRSGTPLFEDCLLDNVYIGRNISYTATSMAGYSPFYRNTSLRSVEIADLETEVSENEFYGCTGLKNVRIGDGVTTIDKRAFSGCSSLDYFEFGTQVKTIGEEAFSDCSNVTRIISHAVVPPVCGSQALDDIQKTDFGDHPGCELYVPQGSMAAYSAAAQWQQFWLNMYEYDPTTVRGITVGRYAKSFLYSLGGQRLEKPHKGIVIVNGKKKLIR